MSELQEKNHSIAKGKLKELQETRLNGFQNASVRAICRHFGDAQRALLADEVGLGKTEVAKGVIAALVEKHWRSKNQNRPFRVAYLCPNLDVAEQNFPKLQLYPPSAPIIHADAGIEAELLKALNVYKETNIEPKLSKSVCNFLEGSSVYTRVCDWLIALYGGADLSDAMDKNLQAVYLRCEQTVGSREWRRASGSPQVNKQVEVKAKKLLENCLEILKKANPVFSALCFPEPVDPGTVYEFNKRVASLLSSGIRIKQDYRLSMQHLYEAEASALAESDVMQLESLTPSTSLKIGNRSGSKHERALLKATLDVLYDPCPQEPLKLLGDPPSDLYRIYHDRITAVKASFQMEGLPSAKDLAQCKTVAELRRKFIDTNLNSLQYDLIIMDEFQNFSELITNSGGAQQAEAYEAAKKLFQKRDSKILMLSATPFRIADYADGWEEEVSDLDQRKPANLDVQEIYDDFFRLAQFMMPEKSDANFAVWKKTWEANRSMKSQSQRDTCRKLLMEEAGIFRTERSPAARHAPVREYRSEVIPSFRYPMLVKAGLLAAKSEASMTGVRSTPYACTFSSGYNLKNPCLSGRMQAELFLSRKDLEDSSPDLTNWPDFEKLQQDLLEGKKPEQASPVGMLWIPPCRHSGKSLRGAFAGWDGFSKTLIFSSNQMTPKSFMFLLGHKVNQLLRPGKSEEFSDENAKALLNAVSELKSYSRTTEDLATYFSTLFSSSNGTAAVRKVYPNRDYASAVNQYCEDGCFPEMVAEYVGLLASEYTNKDGTPSDVKMAKAVRKMTALAPSSCSLLLSDGQTVFKCQETVPNLYAAGLFSRVRESGESSDVSSDKDTLPRLSNLKTAFNSPFWPFVLTTTSIGTEGIDLHWYARNIVHWTVPSRPIDLEQREGRVLRYKCHAFRLNAALLKDRDIEIYRSRSVNPLWEKSGMFESQLNFFSNEEYDSEHTDGCYHVCRYIYFPLQTSQNLRYARGERVVRHYRRMLGQDIKDLQELPANGQRLPVEPLCLSPWDADANQQQGIQSIVSGGPAGI